MNSDLQHSVLIVDDNPNNLYSLHELIRENFKVDVIEASSGFEALRMVNEKNVDLCLMDVQMPEMDGFETARLIRSRPKTAHIPICFITAFDPNKSLMDKGLHAGGIDYLTKPIDDVQIVQMLNMYFRFIHRERNINLELEEKVQQRTFELQEANKRLKREIDDRIKAEAHLQNSKAELQLANAHKDKFFSIIAHDLRNPFNALIGVTEILKDELESLSTDEIKEFVGILNSSAKNAFQLLNNLLDWSRSQTNSLSFQPESFKLAEVIDSCLKLLSGQASKKNISTQSYISSETEVFADKNMLSTIIRNLVSNAIKFTPQGGSIDLTATDTNGCIELKVKDSGVGMNALKIENLFRIESKVQTEGTEKEPGTGLGLILCREFTEKNGGEITVESEPGKGSIFTVSLPAKK
jgi:two-component system sensor histidine kinase/response regulator